MSEYKQVSEDLVYVDTRIEEIQKNIEMLTSRLDEITAQKDAMFARKSELKEILREKGFLIV